MRNKFLDLIGRNHPGTRGVLQPPVLDITWTCHVCGDERRDRFIGVFTREKMFPGGVRVRENIRFCNDRLECTQGANDVHFIKDDHEENDFGRVQVQNDGS